MPRGFLSLPEVILGSLVPFGTQLVGLLTFYHGESCPYFLLVWAFSPVLTCVFLALLYPNHTFRVVEMPPAWEAGPSGGQLQVPRPGRAPAAQLWRYFVWFLAHLGPIWGLLLQKEEPKEGKRGPKRVIFAPKNFPF